jgi:lysophospholipase L1-like esterase
VSTATTVSDPLSAVYCLNMRILLLSDSHGHVLGTTLEEINAECQVLTISVGGKLSSIRSMYQARLNEVHLFRPDIIIIHSGHNDVMPHPRYNSRPIFMKFFIPQLERFRAQLIVNHPLTVIYFSSMLPRTTGPDFNSNQRDSYNKLCIRFRDMLRSAANRGGFRVLLNCTMWASVRYSREKLGQHLLDGLHLNGTGRRAMAQEWLRIVS